MALSGKKIALNFFYWECEACTYQNSNTNEECVCCGDQKNSSNAAESDVVCMIYYHR